ncbi:MAG: HTH domain-containing protein [Solirubrobacterales bacterium]
MGHFLRVAEKVLRTTSRPMSAREIVDVALRDRMLESAGKTPSQTMKAKLSVEIRSKGPESMFVRTSPGRFYLRSLLEDESGIYEAPPLTPPPPEEQVLVYPATLFDAINRPQGLIVRGKAFDDLRRLLRETDSHYIDRLEAEATEDFKQALTYVLVTRGNQVLCFQRGSYNRVADFLRGARCIGFGGHVTSADATLFSAEDNGILGNAARELAEELKLPDADKRRLEFGEGIELVGIINDDSSSVGRRHVAAVYRYEVSDSSSWSEPERGEKSITQLGWLDIGSETVRLEEFEYWSQLCLSGYFGSSVKGAPSFNIRRKLDLSGKHILVIMGEIGSGKSSMTSVLTSDFGYTEVNSGAALAELLDLPKLAPAGESGRAEFQNAAASFINSPDGPRKLAIEILRRARESGADRVVVDGIRQRATLDAIRDAAEHPIYTVYVHTPPDVAFRLYKSRRGDNPTVQEFVEVREAEVESEVAEMIQVADTVVYNWIGQGAFRTVIRSVMGDLGVTRS